MCILDLENFGERLKESIKDAKTNQKNLAAAIGLSTTSVNNYTSGKRVPDADCFYKICSHLNVNMEWILTGKGTKNLKINSDITDDEEEIIEAFRKLSYEEKIIIKGKLYELLASKKMPL